MNRIRVAFIAGGLDVAGAEHQLLYLTRDMDRKRFEPVVINLRGNGAMAPLFRESGVDLVELGYRGKRDVGIVARIRRVLLERRVQVACPYLWPATVWGYAALRWAGIKQWIASERNSGAVYDPPWQVALESRILARAPALVAITNAARDFAIARGVPAERVRVIHIGVAPPKVTAAPSRVRGELGLGSDAPVVGCVARFGPQKDHTTLLRAAQLVRWRMPRARLVLVGDGPLRPRMEGLAAELGLSECVRFTGVRLDAMNLLNACDVAALASSRQEGCSNFLVESALLNKPVVATTVGGIPEAVRDGETGYLVPPEDPDAMADAIVRLLDNPALARRLGAAGATWAGDQFGLSAMVTAWERLLEELVAAPAYA
jgi:glycosyltransferase involved in cell wall biosynthesis